MQDVKGLAVVVYAESLTTQQMRYHRLSRRVNNGAIMAWFVDFTRGGFYKRDIRATKACANKSLFYVAPVVYAALGFHFDYSYPSPFDKQIESIPVDPQTTTGSLPLFLFVEPKNGLLC